MKLVAHSQLTLAGALTAQGAPRPDMSRASADEQIRNNLFLAHDAIYTFSKKFDQPGAGPTFSFWSRDGTNSFWYRRSLLVDGVLPVGFICP
jgi:hypothetical protein